MDQATMIGIDLAKNSFQLHGAWTDGSVAFRKKLSRGRVLEFLGDHVGECRNERRDQPNPESLRR